METERIAPEDADENGALDSPSHWGVHFGSAVDLDGDTLIVGTQWDRHSDGWKTASGDGADWAYVFHRHDDGRWTQAAKLVPDDAEEGDTFAYSVAVDEGSGVAVAGNPARERIYIFERLGDGSWTQSARFNLDPAADGERHLFGYTVAVSGHTVVAGSGSSKAYIYEESGGTWAETGTVPGGILVDLEGDTLVASIMTQRECSDFFLIWVAESGTCGEKRIQLYDRTQDGTWLPTGVLDPAARHESSNTGPSSLDLSEDGSKVILGAATDRRVYGIETSQFGLGVLGPVGTAWIYEKVDGTWVQTADIPNPDPGPGGGMFGDSVAIEDGISVIGARWDYENSATSAGGAAYVYENVGDNWVLTAKLRNHDGGPYGGGDMFGNDVTISGSTLAAGAPFDDQRRDGVPAPLDDQADMRGCGHAEIPWGCDEGENAGSVYIFEPLPEEAGGEEG